MAALQGLTLTVQRGELCVVLGPSGSGKSTLLRIVAGFDRASAGSVSVAGVDVGGSARGRRGRFRSRAIGYADQHYWRALAGELTARELVGVQLGLAGEAKERRDARAGELLERVGLGDRSEAHPRELSGGEQQRLALCAAVAGSPAAPDRRRADGRARRGDRARGARPDRRARRARRAGRHSSSVTIRPRRNGPITWSTSVTVASATSTSPARRRRRDRRRPRRLAATAGGAPPLGRNRPPRDGRLRDDALVVEPTGLSVTETTQARPARLSCTTKPLPS